VELLRVDEGERNYAQRKVRSVSPGRVLAIIPARGGSKGIPRKNIRPLAGKPLIAWSIECGKSSKFIDRLVLSSDDQEIIDVAKRYDCDVPFVRPAEFARDDASGMDPVFHALGELPGYEFVVLLQPTSPLRISADIDACLTVCLDGRAPACVSVVEAPCHPFHCFLLDQQGRMQRVVKSGSEYPRRQDLPPAYCLNGAVYVARVDWLIQTRSFLTEETQGVLMPRERSVDIDTPFDFDLAQHILASRLG